MVAAASARPGIVGRFRSRQSGHPSGLIGRIFGRVMVRDTADANDRAVQLLALDRPTTVLEVGFGQGRTVGLLVERGYRVLGVDSSLTMVRQAVARNRAVCGDGRAVLRHGDGATIPFPDGVADAALSVHTVYFLPDLTGTLIDLARVVRPGGLLVIACRTSDTPVPGWMDPAVYQVPTASHLIDMLSSAGYEGVDVQIVEGGPDALHLFTARVGTTPRPS